MKIKFLHIIIIVSSILLTISCHSNISYENAQKAIIYIDTLEQNEIKSLDGRWEFYNNLLLSPEVFENYSKDTVFLFFVNKSWNSYFSKYKKIGKNAHGTFHLKILAPVGDYALKIERIETAYKLWIDNKLLAHSGVVGTDEESSIPFLDPKIVYFSTKKDTINIVIQVSNYHHRVGGILSKILIGRPDTIHKYQSDKLFMSLFILGSFSIILLYFIFYFVYNRKENTAILYLCLLIVFTIMFVITNGECLISDIFPNIPWHLIKRIDFIGNLGRVIFLFLFIKQILPQSKIFKKTLPNIFLYVLMVMFALIFITPTSIFLYFLYPFIVITFFLLVYLMKQLFTLSINKNKKALVLLIVIIFITFSLLNDLLASLHIINVPYLSHIGGYILVLVNSMIMSLDLSFARNKGSQYSKLLAITNTIRSKLSTLKPIELDLFLKVILNELEITEAGIFIKDDQDNIKPEIIFEDNIIKCAYLNRNITDNLNYDLYNKVIRTNKSSISNNTLISPILEKEKIKGCIQLKNIRNKKLINDVIDLLHSEISSFIDNYVYYYSLENINNNLEFIVSRKVKKIVEQKSILEKKMEELDEKLEELNISNQIVEDMNEELLDQAALISNNNEEFERQNKEIKQQKDIIELHIKRIQDSINYSKIIQESIIKNFQHLPFSSYMEYSSPQKLVSGDIWFSYKIDNYFIFILLDCTGHDTSTAFITIFLKSLFDDLISEQPQLVINNFANFIKIIKDNFFETLNKNIIIKDNFDIFISSTNLDTSEMIYYCENNLCHIVRNNKITLLETVKKSVLDLNNLIITPSKILLEDNDILYIQTDGLKNQLHNNKTEKFGLKNINKLISDIQKEDFKNQKNIIEQTYKKWKGKRQQVDDYLIVAYIYKFSTS